jgi:Ca2+-binding EF-hand superfamily protein
MFKDLKNLYHSDRRARFVENFYQGLVSKLGQLKLSDLKRLINPRNHPLYSEGVNEDELALEFYEVVDSFQFIMKLPRNDSILTKEQFIEFFKFFGFGIEQDDTFISYVSNLFSAGGAPGVSKIEKVDKKFSEQEMKNYYSQDEIRNVNTGNQLTLPKQSVNINETLLEKLRVSLKNFGRKSLFYLIKHFKYYDNGTKFINKYDFAKVIKDFRLNLTITEIEKIFEIFCVDKKGQRLNYEQFVLVLSERSYNENRKFLFSKVYEGLIKIARDDGINQVDLDLVKGLYNSKNHPLGKEEDLNYAEFVECIELFHYAYKNKRVNTITYEEFEEFYKLISFLIEDDIYFEKIIKSEWKKVLGANLQMQASIPKSRDRVVDDPSQKIENLQRPLTPTIKREKTPVVTPRAEIENFQTSQNFQNYQNFENKIERTQTPVRPATPLTGNMTQKEKEIALAQNQYLKPRTPLPKGNDAVEKLKQKLRRRGIRGLMNIHKQFLINCTNPGAISYGDFVKVLKLQKIEFSKEDYDQIFERFRNSSSQQGVGNFLNFSGFIRHFKKILPETRLNLVEKAFASLDLENSEMLFIEDIKLKFDAARHPDVTSRVRSEDDIAMEFLDCFELNYNFLVSHN